jgi:hypothetical protein
VSSANRIGLDFLLIYSEAEWGELRIIFCNVSAKFKIK